MHLIARTSPPAPPSTPPQQPRVSPWLMARGFAVVSGGPIVLAKLSIWAPVAAARRWPDRLPKGAARNLAWAVTAAGVVLPGVYAGLVRPWLQTWGSTEEERRRRYPGDGEGKPLFTVTRAVTVHAPAEQVWRWLVQIGEDKGGFYSYDWLENLAGCRIHSAEEIHEEWQDLRPGDTLQLIAGTGPKIGAVDPPRSLVIEGWGAYVVEPVDARTCRLLARSHSDRSLATLGYLVALELPHAIMERKMLLGIKKRAEREVSRAGG
jgi:hypothetical protein